ncbi:ribonuclease III [Plenodomus tracheiphilus IPT5]|uniref:Ribonuclease III n=1 Tax=Plenodomus tracheiphilus IPT5 TaxID=1408161 RepID=A0A6A7BGC6_9PLEO|nr:ribonuclease III [Plenodomus tracheiphilus IPT5]
MATPKRAGNFSHMERGGKRHQPARPAYSTAAYDVTVTATSYAKPQQKPQAKGLAARAIGYAKPQSTLSTPELQTGLVAVLDRFIGEETTPKADRDVLLHARELRRLLCARPNLASSQSKRDLDQKRPYSAARVTIPDWVERQLHAAKALPPLPPITEPHLHQAVFTHRTANVDAGDLTALAKLDLALDYERLEYSGDAYIELIATRALCNRFPQVDVPELCSWRERLVENSTLSKFSDAYGFPDRLSHRLHVEPGSKAWMKVSADIFEAYIAGLVQSDPEHGFAIAEEWLTELWAPQLLGFQAKVIENPKAKDELNKLVVCKGVTLQYREDKPMTFDTGSIQRYYMGVYLTGWGYEDEWVGSGEGQNKHQAAIAAANAALKNSAVIKDAAQQKAELMETKKLEREAQAKKKVEKKEATTEAEVNESGLLSTSVDADSESGGGSAMKEVEEPKESKNEDVKVKKRKSDSDEMSSEKKKKRKKEKKDKESKKHTANDNSS